MKNYLLLVLLLLTLESCTQSEDPAPQDPPEEIIKHKTLAIVPDDFATIQEAIDQSNAKDTIVVKPGTYSENINFKGKEILVTSMFYLEQDISHISTTIIKGSNEAVVKFMNKEGLNSIIQGFTITGGTGSIYTRPNGNITLGGGGILGLESSPTIRYNIIEGNEATDVSGANTYAGGGGIRLELGSPNVHNNIIRNNKGNFGGGVFLDATAASFSNNVIVGNSALLSSFAGGGGLYLDFVKPGSSGNKIINNTIINNKSDGDGGGLVLAGNTVLDNLVFINNIIFNNENKEVLSRLDATDGDFQPGFCLIEGGHVSGNDIIDSDPKLTEDSFTLLEGSPCIDAGDSDNTLKDRSDGDIALAPCKGTSRNDIGAYGGPNALNLLSDN